VILVEETYQEGGGFGAGDGPTQALRREVDDQAWRNDVALEMWIDVTSDPVGIRLAGVLDESTGTNLSDVVADCVAEGRLAFALDTSALRIGDSGWCVMGRIREQIERAGGKLHWDFGGLA
jgi:hypothetical protein